MNESARQLAMVHEFRNSGKSQRVWCAGKGIKRSTLRYWLERTEMLSLGTEIMFAELLCAGDAQC